MRILHTGDIHLGDLAGPTKTAKTSAAWTRSAA